MQAVEEKNGIAYNPSAIVHIFNNALNNDSTRRIIKAKVIYTPGKGMSYNGYFYDQLKDESSDACISLIKPPVKQ